MDILAKLVEYAVKFGPTAKWIVERVVKGFVADHPHLVAPPQESHKEKIDAAAKAELDRRYPKK